jgi:hypothetical protein
VKTIKLATALLLPALLTGCSTLTNNGGTHGGSSDQPVAKTVVAPLTGVKYDTSQNAWVTGPAVMAKIDNVSDARPQAGLNQTDVVYDEMVEGGLTRLLAVWQSQMPTQLGPVRSVRPMDPDIASPFGGILCFSGGQAAFVKAMADTPVFSATETNQQSKHTFSRVTDRFAPHNVMVAAQHLQGQHLDLAAPASPFTFAASAAEASAAATGSAVESFTVKFPAATALWTWSQAKGLWLRTQDGQPHIDAADKSQIHAVNVVVIPVTIDRSYLDKRYGFVPRSLLIGTGKAVIFTGGKMLEATYSKASKTAPIQLLDKAGNPIKLAVGNTWFELQPKDVGSLNVKAAAASASPSPSATK